jgi:hypothetical protein
MPSHESILSDGMHRRDDKPASRWPVALVALLGAAAVVVGIFATQGAGEVEDQRDTAVEQVRDLGRDVAAACARGEVIQSPDGRNLCQRAAEVQSDPVPGTVIQGEPGRPPTIEEIEAAVAVYLARNPPPAGRPPTADEVAAAVAEYMTAHPPQPGRPPTAEEISNAVSAYFAANPVGQAVHTIRSAGRRAVPHRTVGAAHQGAVPLRSRRRAQGGQGFDRALGRGRAAWRARRRAGYDQG